MKVTDIEKLDFVTNEGWRYKISPKKAMNTYILNNVLQLLQNNGYNLYQLFNGGYIYAQKMEG